MHGFGASGPYKDVYEHFDITPEAAAEAAKCIERLVGDGRLDRSKDYRR